MTGGVLAKNELAFEQARFQLWKHISAETPRTEQLVHRARSNGSHERAARIDPTITAGAHVNVNFPVPPKTAAGRTSVLKKG